MCIRDSNITERIFRIVVQAVDILNDPAFGNRIFHAGVDIHCEGAGCRIASDGICSDAGAENQCKAGSHDSKLGPTGLSFGICFAFRISDKLVIDLSDRTKKNFGCLLYTSEKAN